MLAQRALLHSARRIPRQLTPKRNYASQDSGLQGAQDNPFNRERAAVKHHAAETSGLWRKLALYVAIPALLISGANAYRLWNEHWEHEAHSPPPSERPQYEYLNIRHKAFPWGDGDKTWFWNDKVNYHGKRDE